MLVSLIGILPFIATLATLTLFSGAAFLISGGKTIFGRDIPDSFSDFARSGIPLGEFGGRGAETPLSHHRRRWSLSPRLGASRADQFGRRLYAIGGNPEAARLAASASSACA